MVACTNVRFLLATWVLNVCAIKIRIRESCTLDRYNGLGSLLWRMDNAQPTCAYVHLARPGDAWRPRSSLLFGGSGVDECT